MVGHFAQTRLHNFESLVFEPLALEQFALEQLAAVQARVVAVGLAATGLHNSEPVATVVPLALRPPGSLALAAAAR